MEFDWDDANIAHIDEHGIDREEAEDAVLDEDALDFPAHRGPKGQRRVGVLGKALSGRILVVILEERGETFCVVTARLAEPKERSSYDKNFSEK
jgi:uncharacterized protein